MTEPATTAPEQTYPEIVPAPSATDEPWTPAPDEVWVAEGPATIAEEQTYPESVPAEPYVEPAAPGVTRVRYVDPGSNKFAQALVAAFVDAGVMEPR